MVILDKLMEKKDLFIYIDLRIKHLAKNKSHLEVNPAHRENVAQRVKGRIKELRRLKKVIEDIKKMDKKYWKEAHKGEE